MSAAHVDPALVLRRRALRRSEGKRRLAVLVGGLALLLLPAGYWMLEHSSIFSASRVMVTGATPRVDALVRGAVARDVAGKSLLQVNASALAAKLDALPDVRSVRVDRAFPHTVAVTVVMERAAAFVRDGKVRYVVSADGRVLRTVTRVPVLLPRLLLPIGPVPAAGRTIDTAQMQAALQVLAGVPRGFQRDIARLRGVVANQSGVVAVFGHGLHIRLGDTSALPLKLRIAARVLGKMGTSIQQSVSIVDVSAPARPAVTYKK